MPHVKFVSQPRPEEAAKFRASSNAEFAVLVGEFTSRTDFMQEFLQRYATCRASDR